MTEDYQPGYGQYEPPPAPEPAAAPAGTPKRRRWVWTTAAAVAALFVGVAIGSSGDEPAVAEPTVETVAEVPAACLDALESAEDLMSISADFAGVASDLPLMVGEAAEAGVNYDVAAIEDITARLNEVTAQIEELTGRVESSPYVDEAGDCRAAAEEQK